VAEVVAEAVAAAAGAAAGSRFLDSRSCRCCRCKGCRFPSRTDHPAALSQAEEAEAEGAVAEVVAAGSRFLGYPNCRCCRCKGSRSPSRTDRPELRFRDRSDQRCCPARLRVRISRPPSNLKGR
jgi:hypothetical protein